MTFSIVACDLNEPAWGVAVTSKFPAAVGGVVPWAEAGAVATESFATPISGPLRRFRAMLHRLGYLETGPSGELDDATREAFARLIGNENFEKRVDPSAGWVDRPVLAYLYRTFEG